MHEANQPILMHPLIAGFQWLLLSTPVGRWMVQVGARRPCY
jgi:ribose/xylose/arabinose/galactoside ABC-type transport system permease subunit